MEPLNSHSSLKNVLFSSIRSLLRDSEKLIGLLDEMAREAQFKADLDGAWIQDAKRNVEKYELGLREASLAADAALVSFWAEQFVSMQKYFSDQPLPSRLEGQVRGVALEMYEIAKIPAFRINQFDGESLQAASDALVGFSI